MVPRDVILPGATPHRRAALLVAALAVVAAFLFVPDAGADEVAELRQQLEQARAERADIQGRLDSAAQALGDLEAHIGELSDEQSALTERLGELDLELTEAQGRVDGRVRSLYKHGHVDPMIVLLSTDDPDQVLGQAALVVSLVKEDIAVQEHASARRVEATAVAERLEENRAELDAARTEQQDVLASLETDLERARVLEQRIASEHSDAVQRREEERRRAAEEARRQREAEQAAADAERAARQASQTTTTSSPAPSGGSGYVCPVAKPHSFTDTWGAPRSGGRTHQGTDILAPRGAHIFAVTSGTVRIHGYGSSAGYWLTLHGDNGTSYRYMHLQGYAVGSQRVSAGQLIGYNGDTGNARGTPHLHFEEHPGGRGPINPYPFLRSIC